MKMKSNVFHAYFNEWLPVPEICQNPVMKKKEAKL